MSKIFKLIILIGISFIPNVRGITSNFNEISNIQILNSNITLLESYYIDINFQIDEKLINKKIKFKIYNHNTSNYILNGEIFTTDNKGIFNSNFKLIPGKYEIEYVDIPKGCVAPENPNIFIINNNSEERYKVISYLERQYGLLRINSGLSKIDGSTYKLSDIEYNIYAYSRTYDYDRKTIFLKDQLVGNLKTINGYAELKLPLGRYYLVKKDDEKQTKEYFSFSYDITEPNTYPLDLELTTPFPTFDLSVVTYKENIDKSYSKYEYFKYKLKAKEDIYYLGNLVYKENEIIAELKSDVNGKINQTLNLLPGKYALEEVTINDNYIDKGDVDINVNSYDNNLSCHIYKYLKRGNLSISVNSNLDEKINYLTLFYDGNKKYEINDNLLIKDIKIGKYKLFYDKEYIVEIKENTTTTLNINLLKSTEEDSNLDIKNEEQEELNSNVKNEESNKQKNNIEEETLPNTYNYIKQYCILYEMFLIAGLIIKLYAKKNK